MHKNLRYLVLLLILLFVVINESWVKFRSTSWEVPLQVHIYAINGDERASTGRYIESLTSSSFKPVEAFVNFQARRYGIGIEAIEVDYRGPLETAPPPAPSGESITENIWWSLQFRAWAAYRAWNQHDQGDIELFVKYFDTETSHSLRHSVGLQQGLIGIINAYAETTYRGSNHVVIVHELMHTLGASDQYVPGGPPIFPLGYAEPALIPLHPQRYAEIMGGRIPLSVSLSRMPQSLDEVLVGENTALEINWMTP